MKHITQKRQNKTIWLFNYSLSGVHAEERERDGERKGMETESSMKSLHWTLSLGWEGCRKFPHQWNQRFCPLQWSPLYASFSCLFQHHRSKEGERDRESSSEKPAYKASAQLLWQREAKKGESWSAMSNARLSSPSLFFQAGTVFREGAHHAVFSSRSW